ncbi:hypothetical protein SAMN04487770_13022 [Butyrivibrio sp. ob235]|uniref:glycosyltransferase n=1 Tax=Butyrivibrio sp. ob235 TaxID=1761780 RepID=UPI0008CCC10E|nr:hypothetical protein [Butyrivibrio sp. ob235]SEM24558.1 hypothetical protein SAMN04487770_13022 [Butyrivibrio sp. ob235]
MTKEEKLFNTILLLFETGEVDISDMLKIGWDIVEGKYDDYDLLYVRDELNESIGKALLSPGTNALIKVAYIQLLALLDPSPDSMIKLLQGIRQGDFDKGIQYNLWCQCRAMIFYMPVFSSKEVTRLYLDIYLEIVDKYRKGLEISLDRIPYDERNQNLAVVITSQYTDMGHGPTKSCFYRAKALKQIGKKDVLIINTNDLLPYMPYLPLFWKVRQGVNTELNNANFVGDDEVRIDYFQLEEKDQMDNNSLATIIETVQELRPSFIVNIGGFNIAASLLNDVISVLLVGMAPGQLQYDGTDYFTCSLKETEDLYSLMEYVGAKKESLISSVFTSDLKKQVETHTRAEYGIPIDGFVACIIGARLDVDVDNEFANLLNSIEDVFYIFIGKFEKYDDICFKYRNLAENSLSVGSVSDTLSYIELCDIYINPKRLGGGTSSVEAMSKGVVPVSLTYGDVYYNIGEEFSLRDDAGLLERIGKLKSDKDYYAEMSIKAKKRAEYLCDTKHRFMDTISELENRLRNNKENVC